MTQEEVCENVAEMMLYQELESCLVDVAIFKNRQFFGL